MVATSANSQQNPNSESVYYYHNDHLGTPKAMTDKDGVVAWDAVYRPFGEIDSLASSVENNFRFPGQYEDELNGMYYNHHRYYMPGLGRYNRVDDYRYDNIATHYLYILKIRSVDNIDITTLKSHYPYTSNNPILYKDQSGLLYCSMNLPGCLPPPPPPLPPGIEDGPCIFMIYDSRHQTQGSSHYYRHCVVGCNIAHNCPGGISSCIWAGCANEGVDLTGRGDPDQGDIDATVAGCGCSRQTSCDCCCRNMGYRP